MAQRDFQKQDEKWRAAAERNLAKCADLVIGGGEYRHRIFKQLYVMIVPGITIWPFNGLMSLQDMHRQ